MTMSETHKAVIDGLLQSKTYYYTGFGKGDEIADYSENFKTDGQTIRNVSIFWYGLNRAGAADTEDAMTMSETHKSTIDGLLQSKTYYYTGFGKGDEIADYSENFKTDGKTIRNVSIFWYGRNRASAADTEDAMTMSETHKSVIDGLLQSKTYYYTGFGKGDEIADFSENFKTDGQTIRNVSIFWYGLNRAALADTEDAMTMSETHKAVIDGLLQSKTYYYTGFGKGDEIADYSENFKTDGKTIRNVSIFWYGLNRADAADTEDAMTMSETHKSVIDGLLQSKTYYYTGFGKGDEIADFSENFKTDGETIRNVSIFWYGLNRAALADTEDAMTMSETHKAVIDGLLQSKTYYYTGFGKGDEIADYSENFKTDGKTIRNVSIFWYGLNRADAADTEDAMTMS